MEASRPGESGPVRPIGAKTVAHIRATLGAALGVAMEWHDLERNAASKVRCPAIQTKAMRSLSPTEARAYLEAASSDRLEALFTVTVALGWRQREILGLQWEDVNLEQGTLAVRRSLQRVNGKLKLVSTKTEESARALLLPATATSDLRRHQAQQQEDRDLAGDQWGQSGFVFTSSIGTPLDARSVIRRHHAILKAASISRLRFHDLRHSAASLLLAQGVSPKYVSGLLGHKQVALTMQTYAHLLKEAQQMFQTRWTQF